jgi:alkylhydroperoxidase family enzyme
VINPRIPFPDAPDSPGITKAAYDRFAPEIGAALLAYKTPLSRMRTVGYLTKELVRLRNAHVNGCQICGNFRNPRAIEDGFVEDLTDAVDAPDAGALDREQRAAVRLAEAYLTGATLSADERAELNAVFSPEQLAEIVLSLVSWGANRSTVMLGIDYVGDERMSLDLARSGTDFV